MTLTPYERETVIIMNDEVPDAIIITYQRTRINDLRKNPAAREVADEKLNREGGAEFRIPAKLVNLRRPRRESAREREAPEVVAARMAKARAARGKMENSE